MIFNSNKTLNQNFNDCKNFVKAHPLVSFLIFVGVVIYIFSDIYHLNQLKDENVRLKEEVRSYEAKLTPFRTIIAMEGFTGNEAEQFRKLADKYEHVLNELNGLNIRVNYQHISTLDMKGCSRPFDDGMCSGNKLTAMLNKLVKIENNQYNFICGDKEKEGFKEIIKDEPLFPFSYFFLAHCEYINHSELWKPFWEKAVNILTDTTKIPGHNSDHDKALEILNGYEFNNVNR